MLGTDGVCFQLECLRMAKERAGECLRASAGQTPIELAVVLCLL